VSRDRSELVSILAAGLILTVVPAFMFGGLSVAWRGDPLGVAGVGAGALLAAGTLLAWARASGGGDGPASVADRLDGHARGGRVDRTPPDRVSSPVDGDPVAAYLYEVQHRPEETGRTTDDTASPEPYGYEPVASGLAATGPVAVTTADGRVELRPGRRVSPSFLTPTYVDSGNVHEQAGDPAAYLDRLGVPDPGVREGAKGDDRVRILVEPLAPDDPVTVVARLDGGSPNGEVVVRPQSPAAWDAVATRRVALARRVARYAAPAGAVLVAAGLALSALR
jgi:hypothetical protein